MAWYYYTGRVVRPIPIQKGRSVSVRPNTSVEIFDESTHELQALIAKRLLRRVNKPKGIVFEDDRPVPTKNVKDVVPRSDMAKNIAEKGKALSKDMPPKSKSGVELTVAEENVSRNLERNDVKIEEVESKPVVDQAESDEDPKSEGSEDGGDVTGKKTKRVMRCRNKDGLATE